MEKHTIKVCKNTIPYTQVYTAAKLALLVIFSNRIAEALFEKDI